MKKTVPKVGEVYPNNTGSLFRVVAYNSSRDTQIMFLDSHKHTVRVQASQVFKGNIKNPYFPAVQNVGYLGVGKYTPKAHRLAYITWSGMMERCYSANFRHKYLSYTNCTVHDVWHNFQNFAEWYESRRTTARLALDKDLLSKTASVYSPETCVLIPQQLNNALITAPSKRGDLPLGVTFKGQLYYATISRGTVKTHLGSYTSAIEAFSAYKEAKELFVRELAEKYKHLLEPKAYTALLDYSVNIED